MTPARVPDATEDDAKRAIWQGVRALWQPECVAEMRCLNTKQRTQSGYYDDPKQFAKAAYDLDAQGVPAVYMTLNPVAPALFARAPNQILTFARDTTQDEHIVKRTRLLIDLDAKRPSGISATDDEHDAAIQSARNVRAFLCDHGWRSPLLVDSGNGAHLIFEIDLPNDAASRDTVQRILKALARRFDDAIVEVDQTVHNAARIIKLPGTVARKGFDMPERPHRRSRIIEQPPEFGAAHE